MVDIILDVWLAQIKIVREKREISSLCYEFGPYLKLLYKSGTALITLVRKLGRSI